MKEILKYVYTGKLKIELGTTIEVLKIASFFGLDALIKAYKSYMQSGYLNVFDLCLMYRELATNDFDEFKQFLTNLIS